MENDVIFLISTKLIQSFLPRNNKKKKKKKKNYRTSQSRGAEYTTDAKQGLLIINKPPCDADTSLDSVVDVATIYGGPCPNRGFDFWRCLWAPSHKFKFIKYKILIYL